MAPLDAVANDPEPDNTQKDAIVQTSSDQSAPIKNPSDIKDFSDIKPDHWAYEQLEKLMKDKCVAGFYNDSTGERTFQGDKMATRYEMAILLNYCLETSPRFDSTKVENITNTIKNINNQYIDIYYNYYISLGLTVGLTINLLSVSARFKQDSNKYVKILKFLAAPAISTLISLGAVSLRDQLFKDGPSATTFLQSLQKSEIVIQSHNSFFGQHFNLKSHG